MGRRWIHEGRCCICRRSVAGSMCATMPVFGWSNDEAECSVSTLICSRSDPSMWLHFRILRFEIKPGGRFISGQRSAEARQVGPQLSRVLETRIPTCKCLKVPDTSNSDNKSARMLPPCISAMYRGGLGTALKTQGRQGTGINEGSSHSFTLFCPSPHEPLCSLLISRLHIHLCCQPTARHAQSHSQPVA